MKNYNFRSKIVNSILGALIGAGISLAYSSVKLDPQPRSDSGIQESVVYIEDQREEREGEMVVGLDAEVCKEMVSESNGLEQCVSETSLSYKDYHQHPEVKCRIRLDEYRTPITGIRGLIGVSQMRLNESEHVVLKKPVRSYGRQELVDTINYSACMMKERYDVALVVHDLSREGGGRLWPHKSHRTGKDVDVGIYGYNVESNEYYNTTQSMKKRGKMHPNFSHESALEANWLFLESAVNGPQEIDMIFLDRVLINGLRSYVVGKYGADSWEKVGRVLRHEPGHATHYHIRTKVPVREPKT